MSSGSEMMEQVRMALVGARGELSRVVAGGEIVHEGGGFGGLHDDTEIRADQQLGEFLERRFLELPSVRVIRCEGRERIVRWNGDYLVTVDPLDGSLNYKRRVPGRDGEVALPYAATVAVFERPESPTFGDCIVAGTIDLRTGELIIAERGQGCRLLTDRGHRSSDEWIPVRTSGARTVNLREGIILGEFYYTECRELLTQIFSGERGYLRNCGSAAYEMGLVAAGVADAWISDRQKSHELGAAYRLVVEAGGVGVDLEGNHLGGRPYDFDRQVPVILAATQELADELLSRIQRVRSPQK